MPVVLPQLSLKSGVFGIGKAGDCGNPELGDGSSSSSIGNCNGCRVACDGADCLPVTPSVVKTFDPSPLKLSANASLVCQFLPCALVVDG